MSKKQKRNEENLTKTERKRKEKFDKIVNNMTGKGYEYKELSLPMWHVYWFGTMITCAFCTAFFVPFYLINRPIRFDAEIILLTAIIGLMLSVVHELIHGITWAMYAKNGFKSIGFGFNLKSFSPYCTCSEPLKKSAYIVGGLMPTLILGLIPCAIALVIGNELLLFVGMLMIIGGAGDIIVVIKLIWHRISDKEIIYLDHPYKIGLVYFERAYKSSVES